MIDKITTICLRLLERREHSTEELRLKLKLRGFQNADIGPVLRHLECEDLLNPSRFAKQYMQSRIDRGVGPLKIRQELCERGISRIHIDRAINDWPGDWDKVLNEVYRKKYSAVEPCTELKCSKQVRYLAQRGFSMDQIRRFLSGLKKRNSN